MSETFTTTVEEKLATARYYIERLEQAQRMLVGQKERLEQQLESRILQHACETRQFPTPAEQRKILAQRTSHVDVRDACSAMLRIYNTLNLHGERRTLQHALGEIERLQHGAG